MTSQKLRALTGIGWATWFALLLSACGAEPQWPDTTPIDKTDPYWEFNNNMNVNGTPYHKVEVSPGRWQWVVNEESRKAVVDSDNRKRELLAALRTRVLTDEELREVLAHGDDLNIYNWEPYRPEAKQRELIEALLAQLRIRADSANGSREPRNERTPDGN